MNIFSSFTRSWGEGCVLIIGFSVFHLRKPRVRLYHLIYRPAVRNLELIDLDSWNDFDNEDSRHLVNLLYPLVRDVLLELDEKLSLDMTGVLALNLPPSAAEGREHESLDFDFGVDLPKNNGRDDLDFFDD